MVESQALGLWPIKALLIGDWGWLREQEALECGWKTTRSWDEDWDRTRDREQAWEAVAGQTGHLLLVLTSIPQVLQAFCFLDRL